ncbi:hypothetical protein J3F83DRAFT_58341 [Trichoderma novae-zelandiae]
MMHPCIPAPSFSPFSFSLPQSRAQDGQFSHPILWNNVFAWDSAARRGTVCRCVCRLAFPAPRFFSFVSFIFVCIKRRGKKASVSQLNTKRAPASPSLLPDLFTPHPSHSLTDTRTLTLTLTLTQHPRHIIITRRQRTTKEQRQSFRSLQHSNTNQALFISSHLISSIARYCSHLVPNQGRTKPDSRPHRRTLSLSLTHTHNEKSLAHAHAHSLTHSHASVSWWPEYGTPPPPNIHTVSRTSVRYPRLLAAYPISIHSYFCTPV